MLAIAVTGLLVQIIKLGAERGFLVCRVCDKDTERSCVYPATDILITNLAEEVQHQLPVNDEINLLVQLGRAHYVAGSIGANDSTGTRRDAGPRGEPSDAGGRRIERHDVAADHGEPHTYAGPGTRDARVVAGSSR